MDRSGRDVTGVLVQMLEQTLHRGPDGCGVYVNGVLKKADRIGDLKAAAASGNSGLGHSRLRITGSSGIQPLCSCDGRFVLGFNGEIWNYKKLRSALASSGHVFETDSDGEVIVHLVEDNYLEIGGLWASVARTSKILDGEYAFAVFDNLTKNIVLTRDPVGIKQLYYGQNPRYFAFCSEKKPLWDFGMDPQRVLPGQTVEINFGAKDMEVPLAVLSNPLPRVRPTIRDEKEALDRYRAAIFSSVMKRVEGRDRVGIIYSGGIDSVLIAAIAKSAPCKMTCYTSGFENSPDLLAACDSAGDLGIDLRVHKLSEAGIESELERIMSAIESTDHLQVDVAIPIYFAVREAKKDGVRVMLTGQGADEIFAGYDWYPEIFKEGGDDKLNQSLWNDIGNLYKDTLEREDKIAMYHSIELRVPYLDPEVIGAAMSIPGSLKIKDNHVKYLHRKLAQQIGVPHHLAWRKKEAAQYGSNVHENLLRVVNRLGPTLRGRTGPAWKREALGSAYRYSGKTYGQNEQVQVALDRIGESLGLYPRPVQEGMRKP